MTDKKQDDQNMDAEHKSISDAFKRLNPADDLQPSKELDAIILRQAADAVETSKKSSTNESGSDYDDLTFRRNHIIATEKRMRKKSFLPVWAMPMGLAATVLLSFGVVTKVLLSPEFQEIGMQSTSESVYDDSMIVTGELKSKKQVFEKENKSDYVAASPLSEPSKPEAANGNYKRARSENPNSAVVLRSEQANSAGFSVGEADNAEEESPQNPEARRKDAEETLTAKRSIEQAVSAPVIEPSSPEIPASYEIDIQATPQAHADIFHAPEEQTMEEQTFAKPVAQEPIVIEEKLASVIAPEGDTLSGESIQEASVTASKVKADSNMHEDEFIESELELTLADSVEEIVVTGALIINSPQTQTEGLTEIIFEHRQCQVSYDCALVALECDSCDCVQAVNLSNLDKYDSEFSITEIKEQCLNQNAECVLGYCQAREIEGLSE